MAKKRPYHIRSSRKSSKHVLESIPEPCSYSGSDYGLAKYLTGEGVSVSIIDTGAPVHIDVKNMVDVIDLSESAKGLENVRDNHGHATMVSGVIGAQSNEAITGMATGAKMLFAKVIDGTGNCPFSSVLASVLWSIVREADIILISLGSQTHYPILHDAIKKAYKENICILAAAGNSEGEVDYPARYPEVMAIGRDSGPHGIGKANIPNAVQLKLPGNNLYTTYTNNRYTKASGTSLTAALGAGLGALVIEQRRKTNKLVCPSEVYKQLSSLSHK